MKPYKYSRDCRDCPYPASSFQYTLHHGQPLPTPAITSYLYLFIYFLTCYVSRWILGQDLSSLIIFRTPLLVVVSNFLAPGLCSSFLEEEINYSLLNQFFWGLTLEAIVLLNFWLGFCFCFRSSLDSGATVVVSRTPLSWQREWARPSCCRGWGVGMTHSGLFFRHTVNTQALADVSRPVVHPLDWRLFCPTGASGSGVVPKINTTTSCPAFASISTHSRFGVLIRSSGIWAPTQYAEGSSA